MSEAEWRKVLQPILMNSGMYTTIVSVTPLTGGVSSDIVHVGLLDGREFCAKRALARLKVAGYWQAPLERNHYEVAWLRLAGSIVPGIAPAVVGEDEVHGVALLEYLPPADYSLWKTDLLAGRFRQATVVDVAAALARVHAATWNVPEIAAQFRTDAMFDALRLAPYLRTLAERTPDLAHAIMSVAM